MISKTGFINLQILWNFCSLRIIQLATQPLSSSLINHPMKNSWENFSLFFINLFRKLFMFLPLRHEMFFIGFSFGIINYAINSERCVEEIEREKFFTPFRKINLKTNNNFPIINLHTIRRGYFPLSINHDLI